MWNLSTEIQPNFDGGLMRAKHLKGGFRTVKTKSQRNAIPYLSRFLDVTESTICFVESESKLYRLISNPLGVTIDSDWELIVLGGITSFTPVGTWSANNTAPILSDAGATGRNGQFYFVVNAPTPVNVTIPGLFLGTTTTVVNGNMIVSIGSNWIAVANNTTWASLDKPASIVNYVNGIVQAHTHLTTDITDLNTYMNAFLRLTNVTDDTVAFATVPDAKIPDVGFLRAWYYTRTEIDIIMSHLTGGGGGTAPFSDATPILRDNVDATKLLRFELGGFTTATTRILTPPNFSGNILVGGGTNLLGGDTSFGGGFNLVSSQVKTIGSDVLTSLVSQDFPGGTYYTRSKISAEHYGTASINNTIAIVETLASNDGTDVNTNYVRWYFDNSSLGGHELKLTKNGLALTFAGTTPIFNYAADYSARFTARSLVDKGYVTGNFWGLTGTSTLTGIATITSNAKNQHIFNGTWTATAAADVHMTFGGALTAASGLGVTGYLYNPTLNAVGTSSVQVALDVNPTFVGGTTPVNIIAKFQSAGSETARFLSTGEFLVGATTAAGGEFVRCEKDQNGPTVQSLVNTTNGTAAKVYFLVATNPTTSQALVLQAHSAAYTTSGINVAASGGLVSTLGAGLNIGTTISTQLSFWTNNVKLMSFDGAGNTTLTQPALSTAWLPALTINPGPHTSMTANAEFFDYNFNTRTATWLAGTTPTQRFAYFQGQTVAGATASATFTDLYTVYIDPSIQGTNAIITNNWALGLGGGLKLFAGTATRPALILPTGTNLTTSKAGVLENDGTHLYFTFANSGTRYQLDQQSGSPFSTVAIGYVNASGGASKLLKGDNTWVALPVVDGDVMVSTGTSFTTYGFHLDPSFPTQGRVTAGIWNATILTAPYGGTGFGVYAVGDILRATTTSGFGKLALGTALQVLRVNAGATDIEWAAATGGGVTYTLNPQSSSYTFVLTDATVQTLVQATSASNTNFTVPTNASVSYPLGSILNLVWDGTGQPSWLASGGVTLNSSSGTLSVPARYAVSAAVKTATDTWYIWNGLLGLTNTAAANELMKSNGTNAVSSGIFSTTLGDLNLGTGATGTNRTILSDGSGPNIDMTFNTKGTGIIFFHGSNYQFLDTLLILPAGAQISAAGSLLISANAGLTIGDAGFVVAAPDIILKGNASAVTSGKISLLGASSATTAVTSGSVFISSGDSSVGNADSGNVYLNVGAKFGTGKYGNISFFDQSGANYGGGQKIIFMASAIAAPTTSIAGGAGFYVDPVTQHPMWVIGTQIFDLLDPTFGQMINARLALR